MVTSSKFAGRHGVRSALVCRPRCGHEYAGSGGHLCCSAEVELHVSLQASGLFLLFIAAAHSQSQHLTPSTQATPRRQAHCPPPLPRDNLPSGQATDTPLASSLASPPFKGSCRRRINRFPRPPMIGVIIQRHRQTLIRRPARATRTPVPA